MAKRNKAVQIIILAATLLVGGFAIIPSLFESRDIPVVGSSVPEIRLQQLNGDVQSLSELKGKAVVLNFWGSWCEPCIREMPALNAAYEQWRDQGVEVIGINYGEDALVVNNFTKQMEVTFPVWLDRKKVASKAFGIRPLPTTFFINPEGKVHAIETREVTTDQLNTYIKDMLRKKSSS